MDQCRWAFNITWWHLHGFYVSGIVSNCIFHWMFCIISVSHLERSLVLEKQGRNSWLCRLCIGLMQLHRATPSCPLAQLCLNNTSCWGQGKTVWEKGFCFCFHFLIVWLPREYGWPQCEKECWSDPIWSSWVLLFDLLGLTYMFLLMFLHSFKGTCTPSLEDMKGPLYTTHTSTQTFQLL